MKIYFVLNNLRFNHYFQSPENSKKKHLCAAKECDEQNKMLICLLKRRQNCNFLQKKNYKNAE